MFANLFSCLAFSVVAVSSSYAFAASFETLPIPVEPGAPTCHVDRGLIEDTRKYLAAISQEVDCGQTAAAYQMTLHLAQYLKGKTPLGLCYSDAACKTTLANNLVDRGACDAAGGKSWMQRTPDVGPCVKL